IGLFMLVSGFPKRVWFITLNASALMSRTCCSVIGKERCSAMSRFHAPGPRIVPLPRFPYTPGPAGANAAVLNQWSRVGCERFGSPTRLGRSVVPRSDTFWPTVTVEKLPVLAVNMGDACQFPRILCNHNEANFGVLATADRLKTCL